MKPTFPKEIAEIYDKVMGYFDYEKSAKILDGIIDKHFGDKKVSILELGIGSGLLAVELIKNGHIVSGIDHSPVMLEKAHEKGLSQDVLSLQDVEVFSLNKNFDVMVSHAGPLRFDYDKNKGHFFETYLSSREAVGRALDNISKHLKPVGLLIMSVQSSPERDTKLTNTPAAQNLGQGFEATKKVEYEGEYRIKTRTLFKDSQKIISIEHKNLVLSVDEFNKIAEKRGLVEQGLDDSGVFRIYKKSS